MAASREQAGKLALALVEGCFTQNAVLRVTNSTAAPPQEAQSGQEAPVVWEISLIGTDLTDIDIVPLRLLNEGCGRATVWHLTNGTWQQADTETSGHYLLLNMTGTTGMFCISPGQSTVVLYLVLTALLVVLILATVLYAKNYRKCKQTVEKKN